MNDANCECSSGETASPFARLVENSGGGFFGAKIRETMVHAVVGQTAALRMEKIVALFQRDENAPKLLTSMFAAAESCSTQRLKLRVN
jgi:hypothetical protein